MTPWDIIQWCFAIVMVVGTAFLLGAALFTVGGFIWVFLGGKKK